MIIKTANAMLYDLLKSSNQRNDFLNLAGLVKELKVWLTGTMFWAEMTARVDNPSMNREIQEACKLTRKPCFVNKI
jgi:hypothetical protein